MFGLDRRDEAVSLFGKRFDKARTTRILIERDPDLTNTEVQTLVEVDMRGLPPDAVAELFARDYLAWVFEQCPKYTRGLRLELDRLDPACAGLAGTAIGISSPQIAAISFSVVGWRIFSSAPFRFLCVPPLDRRHPRSSWGYFSVSADFAENR